MGNKDDEHLTQEEAMKTLEQIRSAAESIEKRSRRLSILVPFLAFGVMVVLGVVAVLLSRLLFP